MSIRQICDRCGTELGEIEEEKPIAIEIYFNGEEEPYFLAEDLCENCMIYIKDQIDKVIAKKITRKSPERKPKKEEEENGEK